MASLRVLINPDSPLDLQQRLYQLMCLIAIVFLLGLRVPVNLLTHLPPLLTVEELAVGLLLLGLFLLARKRGRYCYHCFSALIVIPLDFAWFLNGGSRGPVALVLFCGTLNLVLLFKGARRIVYTVVFALNALALYWAEYLFPSWVVAYERPLQRLGHLSIAVPCSVAVCFLLVGAVLTAQESESRRLAESNKRLEATLSAIRVLRGLLPICSGCKKIRSDDGRWTNLEIYIEQHSNASFTHGLCPECTIKYYGVEVAPSQD